MTVDVVHQLRRARLLADKLAESWSNPAQAHSIAEALTPDRWADVALRCEIDPPSTDTAAMAVELLRQDAEQ